jgi:hypothetical protein
MQCTRLSSVLIFFTYERKWTFGPTSAYCHLNEKNGVLLIEFIDLHSYKKQFAASIYTFLLH